METGADQGRVSESLMRKVYLYSDESFLFYAKERVVCAAVALDFSYYSI